MEGLNIGRMRQNLLNLRARLPVGPVAARPTRVLNVTFNGQQVQGVTVTVEEGLNGSWDFSLATRIQELTAVERAIRQQYPNGVRAGDTVVKSNEPINPLNPVDFVAVNAEQSMKRSMQEFQEIMAKMNAREGRAAPGGAVGGAPAGGKRRRRRTQKKKMRRTRKNVRA